MKDSKKKNPKKILINAIERFISDHHKAPKTATIPRGLAWDFCALGREDLGELSQDLFAGGADALNGKKLFGVAITVSPISKDVEKIALK